MTSDFPKPSAWARPLDQGKGGTCTAFALANAASTYLMKRAINVNLERCLGGLVQNLTDLSGMLPNEFHGKKIAHMIDDTTGEYGTIELDITEIKISQYSPDETYMLVYPLNGRKTHCVFVRKVIYDKAGDMKFDCVNSWGNNEPFPEVRADLRGAKLFQVNAKWQDAKDQNKSTQPVSNSATNSCTVSAQYERDDHPDWEICDEDTTITTKPTEESEKKSEPLAKTVCDNYTFDKDNSVDQLENVLGKLNAIANPSTPEEHMKRGNLVMGLSRFRSRMDTFKSMVLFNCEVADLQKKYNKDETNTIEDNLGKKTTSEENNSDNSQIPQCSFDESFEDDTEFELIVNDFENLTDIPAKLGEESEEQKFNDLAFNEKVRGCWKTLCNQQLNKW